MATSTATTPPDSGFKLPYWVKGDTNAFFGLGFNILVNVLVLTGLCIGVVNIPAGEVYGVVLPALGIALVIGNVYYTYLARRLAIKEQRDTVTAMPYGPSVPHMFIVVFVVMLPVFLKTKNPLLAWEAGVAWAFIIGVIILIGAFVGPTIRKYAPRAAMLGTLAGISVSFISMRPAAQMWEALWIALPVLVIIIVGFMAGIKLPGGIPMGLAALLVGTAIAWAGGYMHPGDVSAAASDVSLAYPHLKIGMLWDGLLDVSPLLATAIPLGVYNFTEAMTNVESAAAAGDNYNLRAVLLADGTGAVIGSALGSPFPPAVYIGHPGWKEAGGRSGYSMASGVAIALFCFLGLFGVLSSVLPTPAIVPILLYIGLLIGAQAFQVTPRVHAAAVVAALIPNIASWATSLMDNVLAAAGTSASQVGFDKILGAGVVYEGTLILGQGAILAGLVLGAIVAFLIDKRFLAAGIACLVGAALAFVGLIHGAEVAWNANGEVALGYLFGGLTCFAFMLLKLPYRDDSHDYDGIEGEGAPPPVPAQRDSEPEPAQA
jgi:AGZA family xanthine/uracil permease-like MFS transporter